LGTADPDAVPALAQRQSTVFLAKVAVSQATAGAAAAAAAAAGPLFFPRSLYTLGKARPMRVKREVNVIVCGLAHPA
jgi:hypothetical protein